MKRRPDLFQGIGDHFRKRAFFRTGNEVEKDLAVVGGLEDGTLLFHARTQGARVDEIAVVGHGELPLFVVDEDGLRIDQACRARGGIARVADADVPLEMLETADFPGQVGDQPQGPVGLEGPAVAYRYPRAFLAAVLEGVQAEDGEGHGFFAVVNADDAALFMDFIVEGMVSHGVLRFLDCR